MKTITYKCDRCGAEDTTNEIDLLSVGVHVGSYQQHYSSFSQGPAIGFDQEWCLVCRIKTGLLGKPKDSTIIQTPLTLEDLVREIATDAAYDAIRTCG